MINLASKLQVYNENLVGLKTYPFIAQIIIPQRQKSVLRDMYSWDSSLT